MREMVFCKPLKTTVMDKKANKPGQEQVPEKHHVILPPVNPEEVLQPEEDPEYIIPDDEDDYTAPYEAPEPGEGP